MKVKFEKKDVIVLSVIFLIGISSYAIATGWTAGNAFHSTLYTDVIAGKSDPLIEVNDNLNINGQLTVNGQPVGGSGGVTSSNLPIQTDLSSGYADKVCFSGTDVCMNVGNVHIGYDSNGVSGMDCFVVNPQGTSCFGAPTYWSSCDNVDLSERADCCVNSVLDYYLPTLRGDVSWTSQNGPVSSLSSFGCDDTTWTHLNVSFSVDTEG